MGVQESFNCHVTEAFSGYPHLQLLCCNSMCCHHLSVLQPKPAPLFGLWTSCLLSLSCPVFWPWVSFEASLEASPEVSLEVVTVLLLFGLVNLTLTHKRMI